MKSGWRALLSLGCLSLFTFSLNGYYHYVHFNSRTAPWVPAFERFDVGALPGKTVSYFITDPGSIQLAETDTIGGVISQIRAGAKVWNDVGSSELRIAFGGIVPAEAQHTAPVIEVLFDEMPPGYVALGGPQVLSDFNGKFVPIQRSQVILNKDLSARPSYSEAFFGTLVHEFGHALGLQHTLASATMSTEVTRASSKAKPLTADDIAGLSILYPTPAFAAKTGSISGRVTIGSNGVALASVVAVSPNGPVVSALTLPDGTYRIDGLTPGQYLVYAHPLPPKLTYEVRPANIAYPVDSENKALTEGPSFDTQFYPGVKNAQQAHPISVGAGKVAETIDFSVRQRGSVPLHSVTTYSYSTGRVALKPGYLQPGSTYPFIIATGPGVMANGSPAPGLNVSLFDGRSLNVKTYSQSNYYAQIDIDTKAFFFANNGPRHLLFSVAGDIYILPSAFFQVQDQPPLIKTVAGSVDADNNRIVLVEGAVLSDRTRVLFDGVAGRTRGVDDSGRLIVEPPPAPEGYKARVVALNPDGQSSLFQQSTPPVFTLEGGSVKPAFTLSPASVPAGTDALVTVDSTNLSLAGGYAEIGFGNADVLVRRVWVVSPSRLLASVSVSPTAPQTTTTATLANGLDAVTQAVNFTTQTASDKTLSMSSQLVNAETGSAELYPGAKALLTVNGTASLLSGSVIRLSLNDADIDIAVPADNQLSFTVPTSLQPGPAILKLKVGDATALPIVFAVDPAPPKITAVQVNSNAFDAASPVHRGDLLTLSVSALAPDGTSVEPSKVVVSLDGLVLTPAEVKAGDTGHLVMFTLPSGVPSETINVTVTIDGRTSNPFPIPVA